MNRLICQATASIQPHIRWVKIGSFGVWPAHVSEPSNGVLEFDPAMESDKGVYMCIASTGLETINATVNIGVVGTLKVLTHSIQDSETSIDFVQGPPCSRRERVDYGNFGLTGSETRIDK